MKKEYNLSKFIQRINPYPRKINKDSNMQLKNITWKASKIDDIELKKKIPIQLLDLLSIYNGCIIHNGALHIRGLTLNNHWHSLREAWLGENSFAKLYRQIVKTDIPFAQDQLGDQYFIRNNQIILLQAETGEVELFAKDLQEFLFNVNIDIEEYLNVGLEKPLETGFLLHVYPPFCMKTETGEYSFKAVPANEVILFHSKLANQIENLEDGQQIQFEIIE